MGGGGGSKDVPESSQEKAAAEVALKRYTRYAEVYRPFEEKAFNDITSASNAANLENKVKGQMAADTAQIMAKAVPRGVNPGQGNLQSALGDRTRAQGAAASVARADGLGRDQQIGGLQAAINIGTGQQNEAQLSYEDLAGAALDENISNQVSKFNEQSSKTNSNMMALGAATRVGIGALGPSDPMNAPNAGPQPNDQYVNTPTGFNWGGR